MTSSSTFVNQIKTSLLDNSPAHFTITLELYDIQSNFSFQLFKSEALLGYFILWNSFKHLSFSLLNSWNHSIKIDRSIKWLFSFLVVCLSVKLKDFDDELRDVLDAYLNLDVFVFAKKLFVAASELDLIFILYLFELISFDVQLIVDNSFLGILNSNFLFDGL